jgi:hypothetical protein
LADEFRHGTVGTELSQAEWESITGHSFDSQATGDIAYASSATQLSRLAIGAASAVLQITGGIPAWSLSLGGAVGVGLTQMRVQDNGLLIDNPAGTFTYTVVGAAIAADRQLNLPLITGTDTLSALGLAETHTALKTFSAGIDLATAAAGVVNVGGAGNDWVEDSLLFGTGRAGMRHNNVTSLANGATVDLNLINTGGATNCGILVIHSAHTAGATFHTQKVYAFMSRGTGFTATENGTRTGPGGSSVFSLTMPSNGVVRITNDSGNTVDIDAVFYGLRGL